MSAADLKDKPCQFCQAPPKVLREHDHGKARWACHTSLVYASDDGDSYRLRQSEFCKGRVQGVAEGIARERARRNT